MTKTMLSVVGLWLMLIAGAAHATGAMTCDSGDPDGWQTQEALSEKIIAEGWQVRRVKVDGGCYEV